MAPRAVADRFRAVEYPTELIHVFKHYAADGKADLRVQPDSTSTILTPPQVDYITETKLRGHAAKMRDQRSPLTIITTAGFKTGESHGTWTTRWNRRVPWMQFKKQCTCSYGSQAHHHFLVASSDKSKVPPMMCDELPQPLRGQDKRQDMSYNIMNMIAQVNGENPPPRGGTRQA